MKGENIVKAVSAIASMKKDTSVVKSLLKKYPRDEDILYIVENYVSDGEEIMAKTEMSIAFVKTMVANNRDGLKQITDIDAEFGKLVSEFAELEDELRIVKGSSREA